MQSISVRTIGPIVRVSSTVLALAAVMVTLSTGCGVDDAPADPVERVVSAINTSRIDSFFSDANGFDVVSAYSTVRFPNVGGDARSDVCGRKSDGVYCALSPHSGVI